MFLRLHACGRRRDALRDRWATLAFLVFVRIPFRDVSTEEINNVVDLAVREATRHKAGFPQLLGVLLEILCLNVEPRCSVFPQDVMEVHHAACRGPLEYGDIGTGAEDRHDDRLQRQLQANSTIPSHEERILVHELPALAFADARVIGDAFDLSDDTDNAIPMIALRCQRTEEAGHVSERNIIARGAALYVALPCLDFQLSHHCQDEPTEFRLARASARDIGRIPDHLLREVRDAHF